MDDDLPQPVPGPELRALREHWGVQQRALASRLGIHRVTLGRDYERDGVFVKPIRAAQYRRALNEIVAEATGEHVA